MKNKKPIDNTVLEKGFTEIELSRLSKADWNYKETNNFTMNQLKENIRRNGLVENLIVRELDSGFYEVVNGNHRVDALIDLNWQKSIMVFNLGKISLPQAQRVAIETNETHFERNDALLGQIIKELIDSFDIKDLANSMPFDPEELSRLASITSFDWDEFGSGDLEPDIPSEETTFKLTLEFTTKETLQEFYFLTRVTEKSDSKDVTEAVLEILRQGTNGTK